ncbi:porin [Pontivivens ytuae]|uniref:Porin domain-containing protein n=1 Tax=Pontivivens ytuae TaxID=2789856 RepID=A0A7S9LNW3_9RHOB|nr:hypothetical protein [Pontivivens ytuae]QPH52564.1 hypothetical protein I0K15_12135 [Pontivivens ytuae]
MKRTLLLAASVAALTTGGPALAQDTAAMQAELEVLRARLAALESAMAETQQQMITATQVAPGTRGDITTGDTGIRLTVSGQVNRGVLFTDDGESTDTFFVDNDNSSTRVRFTGEGDLNESTTVGTLIEVEIESNSSAEVSQLNENTGSESFSDRKLELFVDNDQLGRIALGQGDTASNGTSEVDLSNTDVVGYSGVSDFAGGIIFRGEDGELVDGGGDDNPDIGDTFSNLDGFSRQDRIRYDSPEIAGFQVSTSAISDDRYDVALRYGNDFGPVRFEGAIAYGNNGGADADDVEEFVNGSFSGLHTPTGLSLTFAAGQGEFEGDRDENTFYYVKGGWQTNDLTSLGTTAFAVDYFDGENTDSEGDESTTYGVFAVQEVDRVGTEVFLGLRQFEYEDDAQEFDDITAVMAGARVRF